MDFEGSAAIRARVLRPKVEQCLLESRDGIAREDSLGACRLVAALAFRRTFL